MDERLNGWIDGFIRIDGSSRRGHDESSNTVFAARTLLLYSFRSQGSCTSLRLQGQEVSVHDLTGVRHVEAEHMNTSMKIVK